MSPAAVQCIYHADIMEGAMKKHRISGLEKGRDLSPVISKSRLIIIGAGFSGLSAARTILGAAGDRVEVIVLEASCEVGGRAKSGKLPSGTAVELGATWFHGICGNPLYEIGVWEGLVQDTRGNPDLSQFEVDWHVDFLRPFQDQLLNGRSRVVAEEALERFQESALEMSEDTQAPDISVGAFLRRKYDEIISHDGLCSEDLAAFAESWQFREKQQRSFDGFFCADDVSTAFPREFETLEGPNLPVQGGLQGIARSLAAPLDVRFGHQVTAIEWGSGGVSISCSNSSEFEADAVLVTTSIGVLQAKHLDMFHPPLPSWKQLALSAIRLGVVDKIFLEFEVPGGQVDALTHHSPRSPPCPEHPEVQTAGQTLVTGEVWNMGRRTGPEVSASAVAQATTAVMAVTERCASACVSSSTIVSSSTNAAGQSKGKVAPSRRPKQRKSIHTYAFMWPVPDPRQLGMSGLTSSICTATDYCTATAQQQLPGGLLLHPGEGMPFSDLPTWLYGLHSIRFNPGPCWIEPSESEMYDMRRDSGQQVKEVTNNESSTVGAVLWITGDSALEMEALSDEEVQQGIMQLLSTFPAIPVPKNAKLPPKIVRTSWGRDELYRGSYSYLRAGVEDGEAIDILAEPLCAENGFPVVMFAGEATHRQYPGTAHGAYLSGFREANRFLASLDRQDSLVAWSLAAAAAAVQHLEPESQQQQQQSSSASSIQRQSSGRSLAA
ncbi:hypothetical protein CEUSTIGMA_g7980.t1 [Chlamydomonas eustigma]|uniref:Amine oxidase domain-containing protein n=1 Tax=Chlamydomonas eustigma TaxID=1157962 RepID=A0A250XCF2_9CHLO|nr:hypothetical protein CEUSTIGMA_g7980.t1 [Chlamydomonas eustigma]|eukprot:GAX80542.1 hypothetical protein CEUSTIGMA_g7980.t1 [Chlamydomonas eustigma]